MAWYNDLLKAGLGFLGGGPAGAAASVASSLMAPSQQAAPVASSGGQIPSLQTALAQQAFLRGFQEAMAASPQGYNASEAASGKRGGSTRTSQAGGGQGTVPYQQAAGLGGGGGGGSTGSYGQGTPQLDDTYRRALQQALSGGGGLPQSAYQSAITRGSEGFNQQAAMSRQQLAATLAQRGMTNSGAMSQGMAGIEQARLGGLSNLYGGLEEQNLSAMRQAQQAAMGLYGAERQFGQSQQFQQQMYEDQQPSWWESLIPLAGQYAQYRYGVQPTAQTPQTNSYMDALRDGYWGAKPKY